MLRAMCSHVLRGYRHKLHQQYGRTKSSKTHGVRSLAFKQLAEFDWVPALTDKDGGSALVRKGVLEQIHISALAGPQHEETSPLNIR
eukprot:6925364-Pyramimonas_sp.AAC.1